MISRYQITGGGGGADSVINSYSGGDDEYGLLNKVVSPLTLGVGAIAAYMIFWD